MDNCMTELITNGALGNMVFPYQFYKLDSKHGLHNSDSFIMIYQGLRLDDKFKSS